MRGCVCEGVSMRVCERCESGVGEVWQGCKRGVGDVRGKRGVAEEPERVVNQGWRRVAKSVRGCIEWHQSVPHRIVPHRIV